MKDHLTPALSTSGEGAQGDVLAAATGCFFTLFARLQGERDGVR